MADETLSLILFSGTDDKLHAAAVLAVGAAAMGRPINVFLQYWALDAFRADRVLKDHGLAPEADEDGARAFQEHGAAHWIELFEQAKDLGEVTINACADSMEMLGLTQDDLHSVVDGVWGVARFFMEAGAGATFI
jgi:peroxiredoxin family protein